MAVLKKEGGAVGFWGDGVALGILMDLKSRDLEFEPKLTDEQILKAWNVCDKDADGQLDFTE